MSRLQRVTAKFKQSGFGGIVGSALRKTANLLDNPMRSKTNSDASSFQLSAHRVLSRYTSFAGKSVLEVGGAQACESMYPFLKDGAVSGVVSGLDHISEEKKDQKFNLRIQRADALRLSETFEPSQFDIVYGLSIIEHIPTPDRFLDELFTVLRPGGLAYLEGNPIWSSRRGHHVWVATWGGDYQGRATANYLFFPMPGHVSTNPLPDWSHLLMNAVDMQKHLAEKGLPQIDIDCILDWVYSSANVNRLTLSEIAAAYGKSKLTVLEANTLRSDVPQDTQLALRERHGDKLDYGVESVSYVLFKPS
jgi:SAM-dependent methyltransferase